MKFYEIYKDIIGPILCSIIGGICTVIGVYLTIRYEKNKEKNELKERNKPLFYRIDSRQEFDSRSATEYIKIYFHKSPLVLTIINTKLTLTILTKTFLKTVFLNSSIP